MIGSKVSVLQENDTWQPATVVKKCTEPCIYIIKMYSNGKLLRRNRRHFQEIFKPPKRVTFNLPAQGIKQDKPASLFQQSCDFTEINNINMTMQHI